MKNISIYFFYYLIFIFFMSGCGGERTFPDVSSSQGITKNGVGTARLTISATFPTDGSAGEIGKAMIDPNTDRIQVGIWGNGFDTYANLSRSNPTATFERLVPGEFNISIVTFDGNNNRLDYFNGKGVLVEGNNTFNVTLLRGNWEFVDATGAKIKISLNKTLSTSQESIWGFSIIPSFTQPSRDIMKTAIDKNKPWATTLYRLMWRGDKFNTNAGAQNRTYHSSSVYYVNQFIGPNTSNNAIDMSRDIEYVGLPLTPSTNFSNYTSFDDIVKTDRFAFIVGLPVDFDLFGEESQMPPSTFTQNGVDVKSEINSFANTKVVDGTTMTGTIVEIWEKSFSEGTMKCYEDPDKTREITCPFSTSASIKKSSIKAIKNYLANAFKSGIKKSAVNADGCMLDVTNTWTDEYVTYYNYGNVNQWFPVYVVIKDASVTFDACMHPFTAKASALSLP